MISEGCFNFIFLIGNEVWPFVVGGIQWHFIESGDGVFAVMGHRKYFFKACHRSEESVFLFMI